MAEEYLSCPVDMSREIYTNLLKDYDRAMTRLRQSINDNARPKTIENNQKKRDDAREALKNQLNSWKNNTDLRGLILNGNVSSAEAVELLKKASLERVANHNEVMEMLTTIRDAVVASSSYSSTDVPMVVAEPDIAMAEVQDAVNIEAPEEDENNCVICMDLPTDFVVLPCCFQGNKRACKTCFIELMQKQSHGKCPCCRSDLNVNLPRFLALVRTLQPQLPKLVMETLLDAGRAKIFIPLGLVDFDGDDYDDEVEAGQWYNDLHVELHCHDTAFSSNPLFVNLTVGDPQVIIMYPLLKLSVAGDEIDTFVRGKLNGHWPVRCRSVRITCGDCPFPMHYYFRGFKHTIGGEAVCECISGDDSLMETVLVPLSQITTWKQADVTLDIYRGLQFQATDLPKKVIFRMYNGHYELCFIKRILNNGVGPQLAISSSAISLYDRVVYLGLVDTLLTPTFIEVRQDPVYVYYPERDQRQEVLHTPCVVKPIFEQRDMMDGREMTLMGYSKVNGEVGLHMIYNDSHHWVKASKFAQLSFVRALE